MLAVLKWFMLRLPISTSLLTLKLACTFMSQDEQKHIRNWWYRRVYDGRNVDLQNKSMYLHTNDLTSETLFTAGSFDKHVFKTLQMLAPRCKSYIDIGANIGAMTIDIGKSTVLPLYAIEPVSRNFDLLQKNLETNRLSERTVSVNIALGTSEGSLPIYLSDDNFGDHRLTAKDDEKRSVEYVDIISLDTFMTKYITHDAPYLIKMDVQGYEQNVLLGAKTFLKQPCIIVTEIWPYGFNIAGSSIQEFESVCHSLGLTAYHLPENDDTEWRMIDNMRALFDSDDSYQHQDIILTNMTLPKMN